MDAVKEEQPTTASAIHVLLAACDARRSTSAGDPGSSSATSSPPETPRSVSEVSISETVEDRKPRARANSVTKTTTSSAQTPPRAGVNASRDRMKLEMAHLRDTVAELQRQLDEIKRDHVKRSPRPLAAVTPSTAQLLAAWEAMARGQCEQRYRAEVENVKLRKMLDEQIKTAQTLERILTKRRNAEQWLGGNRTVKRARPSSPWPAGPSQTLGEMHALLPSLYSQIDTVLAKECFAQHSTTGAFRNVDVRQSEDAGTFVEVTEKRLLPFTHGDVGDAVWASFVSYPDSLPAGKSDELQAHLIVRDLELSLQLPRFTGTTRAVFTARRYVDTDRVVVVWVARVDPSGIPEPALDGVHIRHTGWVCVRASSLPNAMTEHIAAQVSAPEFLDDASDRKQRRVGTLTTFLVSALHSQLDITKQNVDNCLLERSLARHRACDHSLRSPAEDPPML